MVNGDVGSIVGWLVAIIALSFVMQELQVYRAITEVENYLGILRAARDRALSALREQFRRYRESDSEADLDKRIYRLVEVKLIPPTDLDPYGIVKKLKHILMVGEESIEREVSLAAPKAAAHEVKNLVVMAEIARALNEVYKQLNHYYLIARRFKSLWLLMQLNAVMPFIMEEVRAIEGAVEAFRKALPIGDSAGPLVATFLMRKYGVEHFFEPAKDTVVAKVTAKGKDLYVVKAKGPGGTTGHYDDAVEWVFQRAKPSVIVTVDAALKYEGEPSGIVAHGYGVAIGGVGVEKYGIEEVASRHSVPLYAVLIKMSESEALSIMTEEIYRGVREAVSIVEEIIEKAPEGSTILLIGVGNTVGVPQ